MTDPWSADFDDLRVFSLAMQNKLELSVWNIGKTLRHCKSDTKLFGSAGFGLRQFVKMFRVDFGPAYKTLL